MFFSLGNWLLKWQPANGDFSTFVYQVMKWVFGASGLGLLVAAAVRLAQPSAIVYGSLGVICVVVFLILYIRDARADRQEAGRIAARWESVGEPPHPPV